jgi:hypothetical protein
MTGLLGAPYSMAQASYDLARLARNGLITRCPHANTYDLRWRCPSEPDDDSGCHSCTLAATVNRRSNDLDIVVRNHDH